MSKAGKCWKVVRFEEQLGKELGATAPVQGAGLQLATHKEEFCAFERLVSHPHALLARKL